MNLEPMCQAVAVKTAVLGMCQMYMLTWCRECNRLLTDMLLIGGVGCMFVSFCFHQCGLPLPAYHFFALLFRDISGALLQSALMSCCLSTAQLHAWPES